MKIKQIVKPGLAVLAAGILSACATKSNVKADGTTDNPVFPKPYSLTFNNKRGTFPTYDELDLMLPGLTKDDIYKILGRPHYDEGMYGVREWDYLFHFHTPGVGTDPENTSGVEDVTTCQYKVVFDKDKFARSFYWNPVFPKDAACSAARTQSRAASHHPRNRAGKTETYPPIIRNVAPPAFRDIVLPADGFPRIRTGAAGCGQCLYPKEKSHRRHIQSGTLFCR